MQTDTQMSHDLVFLSIHLEERGVRIELGELVRSVRLFPAVRLYRLFELRLASQVSGEGREFVPRYKRRNQDQLAPTVYPPLPMLTGRTTNGCGKAGG